MRLKKAAFYFIVALLIAFLVRAPGEAAKLVQATGENAGEIFSTASEAFTRFLRSLI